MIKYFISYAWSNSTGSGFGNCSMRVAGHIQNIFDIKSMQKLIAKNMGQDVTIIALNYIELPANNQPSEITEEFDG